ncbi:hypothetical protein SAMN05216554_1987 [Herbiconiux ginsengi]|uniref:Uncharacterized protein n=1 Tax=Herbiconiux ginsengi TaxID=381665 RepID=A0A1H3PMX9_9MICO|nr:hypothetical protein SAMN05216554_1987 [Herbiconiux ginsengi]
MAHSPHRRWRGCALCKPHKIRGAGASSRTPPSVLRKVGRKRRWNRNDIDPASDGC